MAIAKRRPKSSKPWILDYRSPDGRRRWEAFATKKQAELAQADRRKQMHAGEYVAPSDSRTLADVYAHWLKLAVEGSDNRNGKPLAPATQALYSLVWRLYVAPKFGTRKLRAVEGGEIAEWKQELGSRVGPKSVLTATQQLDALFKHARRFKWTAANPLESVHKPKYKAHVRAINPAEFAALMQHADGATRLLLRVTACTGLRARELFGVRFSDIDFATGMVSITRQLRDGQALELKTPKSRRRVPLPASLVKELREHPRRFGGGLVFLSPEGTPIILSNFHHRIWQPLVKAAGIEKVNERGRVTFHSLRHSAATAAIAANKNVATVQAILGHASAVTTLNTYADAWAAQIEHSGEDIARIMFGASGSSLVASKPVKAAGGGQVIEIDGAPGEIRTPDPQVRR